MVPEGYSRNVSLASFKRNQSLVAGIGDSDNSLSMRWVKLGSCGAMNHAAGGGGGWHCTAAGGLSGGEYD